MNRLPDELILMIFEHLGFKSLITSCRPVCKRWFYLVQKIKINEIVTSNGPLLSPLRTNFWCYALDSVDYESSCFCHPKDQYNLYRQLQILEPPFKQHFSHLKRLAIYWSQTAFDIKRLECLLHLEHLELEGVYFEKPEYVRLPSLKILKLSFYNELTVDSDNLQVLIVEKLKRIKLAKPHTLKHLEVLRSEKENLKEFTSLEFYKCLNVTLLDEDLMFKIPDSLKELHLNCFIHIEYSNMHMPYEQVIGRVLEHRSTLGKDKLKIYFKNVELIDDKAYKEYGFNEYKDFGGDDQNTLDVIYKNYDHLASHIPWLHSINYTKLMNKFEQKLPAAFFEKFPKIISVASDSSFDDDHFIWFLKNCKIVSLSICGSSPDQDFLDQLPYLCPLLNSLTLKFSTKTDLNYDFLYKFKRLLSLHNTHLPVEHALNFVGKLRSISFDSGDKGIYTSEDHCDRKLFILTVMDGSGPSKKSSKASGLNAEQLRKIFQNLELYSNQTDIMETLNKL